ncbi:penicillin acylase family protein [Halocynthiibacter styelae]|uniref:Penicillin acylase family protein n=1 Tax=Halocynthiibacter styelae TaxID=2761955 RepID=A0A8J7J311_9RHOB|nr:penicillin acylase family protein [Paenihalocynthiibacter styelae]MBI1492210.1 penicillin acylase family protein [Paenihalocynthiibacter styelae]
MARLMRWTYRIFVSAVILSAVSAVLVYYLATRSLPEYDADYSVTGLSEPIEIIRSNAAVPHIFASSDAEAWFGLGFVHAQDRLWQMVVARRTAQGRLSEVFGEDTADTDELMRRMGLYGTAQQSLAVQDEETLAVLEAYAAGVNAWIDTVNAESLGRGAPEFFFYPSIVEPWQPADSIAMVKLMALRMSGAFEHEVLRARMALFLTPDQLKDLLPDIPGDAVAELDAVGSAAVSPARQNRITDVPDMRAIPGQATMASSSDLTSPDLPLSPFPHRAFAGASNVFAAAPSRSATGASLLANDPHFDLTAPAIWYLARLELTRGGLIGATVPGIPGIWSGRNTDLAWGFSASTLDDLDIFLEELNPENRNEYVSPSGPREFTTREETIRIRDAAPRQITLRWSDNGPILPAWHYSVGDVTPPNHVAAVSWTALSPADTSVAAIIGISQAHSIETAIDAGEAMIAPSINLTIAESGRVALKTLGAFPRRGFRQTGQGRIPSLGSIAFNQWQGRLPYDQNPEFVDPDGGIVGNTNNKITDAPFPRHMTFNWGDSQRVQRWKFLMQNRRVHTRDSFIDVQLDEVSTAARTLLALVGAELWYSGTPAPDGTSERRRQQALELLSVWNGEMNEHLPEPLLYATWMRHLQDRLIRDDLGDMADAFTSVEPLFLERVFRDIDGASRWCDIVQTSNVETCPDMAQLALDEALIWIDENIGGTPESQRWGDQHEAWQDHSVLGDNGVLGWIVNIRQSTSGSDEALMRGRMIGSGKNPYANVHAASYRGVYDFADPDSSVFVLSTGQSGHPLSRFYDNLGELWRRGEYIPMSLDPELARAANAGISVLTPAEASE